MKATVSIVSLVFLMNSASHVKALKSSPRSLVLDSPFSISARESLMEDTSADKVPLQPVQPDEASHPGIPVELEATSPRGGAGRDAAVVATSFVQNAMTVFYFGLWYALNVVYNILNKKVLNVLPAPMTVGCLQLGVGCLYACLLWTLRLRSAPTLTGVGRRAVSQVGLWHSLGQLASMVSLGAGPVSFTHIVKALEPFFSAVVSGLIFRQWMHPAVYSTLIPVVGGVGYACLKERSFSWLAFWMAMGSNLAFALRAVFSKMAMVGTDLGTNITSTNVFAMVTIVAFFVSIPLALLTEGHSFMGMWSKAIELQPSSQLVRAVVISGMFHYLNNEVMYLALAKVHPVTLAVGNTMKRVFIMIASVMVFGNVITGQAALGSAIGISGVLLYSLTKQHYEKLETTERRRR